MPNMANTIDTVMLIGTIITLAISITGIIWVWAPWKRKDIQIHPESQNFQDCVETLTGRIKKPYSPLIQSVPHQHIPLTPDQVERNKVRQGIAEMLNPCFLTLLETGCTPEYYKLCRIQEYARRALGV